MQIFLAVFIALVCTVLMIFIKVLDYKIEEISSLIDNLNDWAYYQGKLVKRLLYELETICDKSNSKER